MNNEGIDYIRGLFWRGVCTTYTGDSVSGNEDVLKAKQLLDELDDDRLEILFWMQMYFGGQYVTKNDSKSAIKYYSKCYEIAKAMGDADLQIRSLNYLGEIYQDFNLDMCFQYYQKGLELIPESKNPFYHASLLEGLAKYHWQLGESVKSLEFFKKSLLQLKSTDYNSNSIANLIAYIGRTYIQLNEPQKAIESFEEALSYLEEGHDPLMHGIIYLLYVELYLAHNDLESADKYVKKIDLLVENIQHEYFLQTFTVNKGFLLMRSRKLSDKARAEQLFTEILQSEISSETNLLAYEGLLELLLDQIRISEDKETMQEFGEMLEKYRNSVKTAKQSFQYPRIIKSLILSAKFSLLQGDLEHARNLYLEAKQICDEKGLKRLSVIVDHELLNLEEQFLKWDTFVKTNPSLGSMVEKSMIQKYISQAVLWLESNPD
jgi:tetratricopeptide (TPR) repeat protein